MIFKIQSQTSIRIQIIERLQNRLISKEFRIHVQWVVLRLWQNRKNTINLVMEQIAMR